MSKAVLWIELHWSSIVGYFTYLKEHPMKVSQQSDGRWRFVSRCRLRLPLSLKSTYFRVEHFVGGWTTLRQVTRFWSATTVCKPLNTFKIFFKRGLSTSLTVHCCGKILRNHINIDWKVIISRLVLLTVVTFSCYFSKFLSKNMKNLKCIYCVKK